MRRGFFTIGLVLALTGCGGEIGDEPQRYRETFEALVNATPGKVQPGQWVKFDLEVTSHFSKPMLVNLEMRLVQISNERLIYTKRWEGIQFNVNEVYKITENFLSATDTSWTAHRVELEATNPETGEVVWSEAQAATVVFGI